MNTQYSTPRHRFGRLLSMLFMLILVAFAHAEAPLSAASTPQAHGMKDSESAMAHTQDQAPAVYSCPMHPEETSHQADRCSICGMFLVKQAKAESPMEAMGKQPAPAMGHEHDDHAHEGAVYSCPMHPDETSDQPGRCDICGMLLIKQAEAKSPMKEMGDQPAEGMGQDHHDHTHATVLYSCPMHPDEISHEPGKCSQCGMFLVKKVEADIASNQTAIPMGNMDHQHEPTTVYACPMHPGETSDQPGRCDICGMFLVKAGEAEQPTKPENLDLPEPAKSAQREHQTPIYVCPMHPQIISQEAGSCPICGMDLVTRETAGATEGEPQVFLTAAVIQNMGVRTTRVEKGLLSKKIRTQGRVTYDDDRIIQIHPRTSGWIETLYVRTDGVRIERKDDLADYFSPDVLWAQQDYIAALEESEQDSFGDSDEPDPARAFRERSSIDLLKYFKVPTMDIMGLERSMQPRSIVPIKAPQGGVLIEHNVREGTFVTPADNIFTIADLSEVWVIMDIFEHQLAWIRPGLPAEISSPAYPGRTWPSKIDFLYPEVDPKTRTIRARLEVRNPDERLMPNMFVQIDLTADTRQSEALIVPREAVILTGERELVVKALGKGHFQPVDVTTGIWSDNQAEILTGLAEGDEVVVSGQFLIDSESNLQASFLRMSE